MNQSQPNAELLRLEVLQTYKRRFAANPDFNVSPFGGDGVIRYGADVTAIDVPVIHAAVRERVESILKQIANGQVSQVVILTGNPGMGKTHLINSFRNRMRAEELGYVLICNSNHWKSNEFEECLLDWILNSLVHPAPDEPHILLDKINDIAFLALQQILSRPREIDRFRPRSMRGSMRRLWTRLIGSEHNRFERAIEERDVEIFQQIDFPAFSTEVCKLFLADSSNIFHRYVLHVLLRYVFPSDREKVLHWLRRGQQGVGDYFLERIGFRDSIDRHYKVFEVIKVLVSLFTPDVASKLRSAGGRPSRPLIFFFAFDQSEAREALFESPDEWRKFFAQLSELYNALPNVFVLFTMTHALRNQHIASMEAQFRDRIRNDPQFILGNIEQREVLALYRQRLDNWLGPEIDDVRPKLAAIGDQYLPFGQPQLLEFAGTRTIRDIVRAFDEKFRSAVENVIVDVPFDFQVARNEIRGELDRLSPYKYTESHLDTIKEVLGLLSRELFTDAKLEFEFDNESTEATELSVLQLKFFDRDDPGRWVRTLLARLPWQAYQSRIQQCIQLIAGQGRHRARNLLWLVRVKPFDTAYAEDQRPGQIFARELDPDAETDLRAVARLWKRKSQYRGEVWASGEKYLLEKVRATYLGELIAGVRQVLERNRRDPADIVGESVESMA